MPETIAEAVVEITARNTALKQGLAESEHVMRSTMGSIESSNRETMQNMGHIGRQELITISSQFGATGVAAQRFFMLIQNQSAEATATLAKLGPALAVAGAVFAGWTMGRGIREWLEEAGIMGTGWFGTGPTRKELEKITEEGKKQIQIADKREEAARQIVIAEGGSILNTALVRAARERILIAEEKYVNFLTEEKGLDYAIADTERLIGEEKEKQKSEIDESIEKTKQQTAATIAHWEAEKKTREEAAAEAFDREIAAAEKEKEDVRILANEKAKADIAILESRGNTFKAELARNELARKQELDSIKGHTLTEIAIREEINRRYDANRSAIFKQGIEQDAREKKKEIEEGLRAEIEAEKKKREMAEEGFEGRREKIAEERERLREARGEWLGGGLEVWRAAMTGKFGIERREVQLRGAEQELRTEERDALKAIEASIKAIQNKIEAVAPPGVG
jgi:hypothetical protein